MHQLAVLLAAFGIFGHSGDTINFDALAVGATPQSWSLATTHKGAPGRWIVQKDSTAPSHPYVLGQMAADPNRNRFALALYDNGYCKNGDLSVNVKFVSGKLEQTAGLVWRYQDPNNYYFLQVSATQDSIGVYRMTEGRAVPVARLNPGLKAFAVTHRIDPQEWNLLRVSYKDTQISIYFDHRKVMDALDATLAKPGKTGLWTKGDTVAYFDDFKLDRKKD